MKTHRRPRADRAGRRSTASRCRSAITLVFALPLLAAACGSDPAVGSTLGKRPPSEQADDVVADTIGALATVVDSTDGGDDDDPDYTTAELELLLDSPATDGEMLDVPGPGPLESGSPEAAIEAIDAELGESTATTGGGTPILDRVEPLDDGPTGIVFGIRDGRRINEAGEAIRLDEQAALACGNVEIALTALDEGRPGDAAGRLRAASTMTADSSVSAMNEWSSILDQAATEVAATNPSGGTVSNSTVSNETVSHDAVPALLGFLAICTQGGYEL